ncbi:MAG: cupin domain-containing protein [Proteobacteria bacterium]|nr:cupin domain-containing protein [Pseudomonadota bacterium]
MDRSTPAGNSAHGLGHTSRRRLGVTVAAMIATAFATPGPARSAQAETLVPLLQQAIPKLPGKTLTAITVIFPPGAASVPHRHGDAFLYAYVLEGAVRSQIEGQPAHIYKTGESWTEKPGDHHVMTENASSTETARLLVVFVADTGAPLKTDDPRKEP